MTMDYFAELGGRGRWPDMRDNIDEVITRYHTLIATGHKKDKGTGADALREQWGQESLFVTIREPDVALWQPIATPTPDLALLPLYSFSLRFTFTLAQPYLSKDDNAFYIVDNPIVRDKVFRLPMVRPSSWKGNLYAALWQQGYRKEDDDVRVQRLFGEIRGEESGQAGRLIFFPTFFTQTSLEVINPHDRKTKVGQNPILFESVPIDAEGTFTLLYVPFDRVGKDAGETRVQVAQELPLLARGLEAMFCVYGFSAKRTSGFGLADNGVADGRLAMHAPEFAGPHVPASTGPAAPLPPALPRYLAAPGRLKPEYLNADGTFRERNAAELSALRKADRQEYDKAKKWWEREGRVLVEGPSAPSEPPAPAETPVGTPKVALLQRDFNSLSELVSRADEVAEALQRGGAR